jgi:hypothetical protein
MDNERKLMAYIAGLMDGDGSFSIIKENRSRGSVFTPCIQLSNVFKGMCELLHELFKGSLKQKSIQKHARRLQYVWNIRGFDSCRYFLNKVIPFLVLKNKRAIFLNEFINNFSTATNREIGKDGRFLLRDISDKGQSSYHLKMKSLNNDCLVSDGYVVKQAIKNTDDPNFWSYFAGIMDTEGSFSIRKNKPSHGSKNYRHHPVIQLSMATFETMNFIRKNTSFGKICFPKAKTTQRGFVYKLAFSKVSECIFIIEKLIPFLRFKNHVAKKLLDFCTNYTSINHRRLGIPLEELNYREECYQIIVDLNKNGFNKPSLIDSETLKLGDEGQVSIQPERLSAMDSTEYAIV